jgi:hypothetical protein
VEGYTDNIGTDEYNQKLSEQRADAVREFLVAQSVADANITAQGYGKSNPIADNSTLIQDVRRTGVWSWSFQVRPLALKSEPGAVSQSGPASQPQSDMSAQSSQPVQSGASSQTVSPAASFTGTSNPPQ